MYFITYAVPIDKAILIPLFSFLFQGIQSFIFPTYVARKF